MPGGEVRTILRAPRPVPEVPEPVSFFQDVSAQRGVELALLESERAVLVQRGMLQAERALAARLQDTLLPIPEQSLELAGLRIDVAYVPADSGVNVGGDWYSAIGLPDESALFVVGDVAGHGLAAVGTMAQLRFTTKGMTVTGSPCPTSCGASTPSCSTPPRTCSTPPRTRPKARPPPWSWRATSPGTAV